MIFPTIRSKFSLRRRRPILNFGIWGYLLLFVWLLTLTLLFSGNRMKVVFLLSLGIAVLVYPTTIHRLIHWRWLVFLGFLLIPNMLWNGPRDTQWIGVSISSTGLQNGLTMAMRAFVIILTVDGVSTSVSISEIAGLFERVGIRGLGFALGIAVNLLPILRQNAMQTWHSLWLRGGFRKNRFQSVRLFLVTVISNTLRRASDIGLAAEARAFSPDRTRPLPLKTGNADILLAGLLVIVTIIIMMCLKP